MQIEKIKFMESKPSIIYIYDALCGWCYGFSSVMKSLYSEHGSEYNFEVLSGGMVLGDRVGPISNIAPFIKQAMKPVEDKTGIKFGEHFKNILNIGSYICNSELSAVAMMAFKQQLPEKAVLFSAAIQEAFYFYGESLNDKDTYIKIAENLVADIELFENELNNPNTLVAANKDFDMIRRWGVTAFPAVLHFDGKQKLSMVSQGYIPKDELLKKLAEFN